MEKQHTEEVVYYLHMGVRYRRFPTKAWETLTDLGWRVCSAGTSRLMEEWLEAVTKVEELSKLVRDSGEEEIVEDVMKRVYEMPFAEVEWRGDNYRVFDDGRWERYGAYDPGRYKWQEINEESYVEELGAAYQEMLKREEDTLFNKGLKEPDPSMPIYKWPGSGKPSVGAKVVIGTVHDGAPEKDIAGHTACFTLEELGWVETDREGVTHMWPSGQYFADLWQGYFCMYNTYQGKVEHLDAHEAFFPLDRDGSGKVPIVMYKPIAEWFGLSIPEDVFNQLQ